MQGLFQSAQHLNKKKRGSGSGAGAGAGSVPLTNGSGRPKNMRILGIRIRIPNTVGK
jgi:hypothetical protein